MSTQSKRQGMAISSLILGIFSILCLGIFAGVPAIFLGHMASRRARTRPEEFGGGGLAKTGFILGYVSIPLTLILAGLLLPALAKAKGNAQSIMCVNNLKNVGLALRIWATDHQDRFPFNVPTNENGANPGAEAALKDPMEVWRALAGELGTPRLLVCPADGSKHPAASFVELSESNVSYDLEMSPTVTPNTPNEVLASCPVHGHELLCDGSVHQRRR